MSLSSKPKPLKGRPEPRVPVGTRRKPVSLESGDRLTSTEFLRRYETRTDVKKAQLIEGTVVMPSPVRAELHAKPDGIIQLWLGTYVLEHPALEVYSNATLLLDPDNALQPDAILCTAPQPEGKVWLNDNGYLCGAPELVCEIAASSVSIDLHDKFRAYRRNGIPEYLVWLVEEERVCWFHLVEQDYVEQEADAGRLVSGVFPGLVLDIDALLQMDRAKVIATLREAMTGV
ncbi:MAG TPA: Uma2 family endonuclease [Verrucomicrobiales bacterium]|nr:Uma2 family endonuclease [Verrucomicrobiales bacterium]